MHAPSAHETSLRPVPAGRAVILTTEEMEDPSRGALVARELASAFQSLGFESNTLDYKIDVRSVSSALADPDCRFFVGYNGFGSELVLTSPASGQLLPAFEHYGKPLFDLMDDCPIHESMRHQFASTGAMRKLMVTDYGHAYLAKLAGMQSVGSARGIAFPASTNATPPAAGDRNIEILVPLDDNDPEQSRARHEGADSYKSRVFLELFKAVTERALSDLQTDPWAQTLIACQQIGMAADMSQADLRFLMSSIADHVTAHRQRRLIEAVRHLRVTFAPRGNLRDRLRLMSDAKVVVCPASYGNGARLLALEAFSAGAMVIAPPDDVLEMEFEEGSDLLIYRDVDDLASKLDGLTKGTLPIQQLATSGRARALECFSPLRLARAILSMAARSA